tara:strand:- start:1767 stop:2600 length:834 start_codon:yes stop_codon:yes gene_type:complete
MNAFFQILQTKRKSRFAIYFLFTIFVLSILIPFLSPYSEDIYGAVNFKSSNQPPSLHHWFGTDSAGRDLFTITIKAATLSYKIAFFVVFFAIIIGCPLGFIAGMSKKWIDELISRITDGFLAFPPLILPIMITSILGPSINNVIIGISISWFPWYVRIARSQTLILKNQDYILMAKTMGANNFHIIKKHILPNSLNPILIQGSIDAGYAILIAAGLSFIGLGAQPPQAEWGLLITQSRAQFLNNWWVITFPGIFIVLSVLSFNIIGDDLRNITTRKK